MKKEKKKTLKIILLIIGIILIIGISAIAYLVVTDLKQEDILKQEIVNVSNKDLLTDNYNIEVKTTGDYAYIEEAIKKFYLELSNSVKTMNSYLKNKELINILSAENLAADQPNFEKSYKLLDDTKNSLTSAIQSIANLCEEETIKNLIDKEKVDNYYYELYKNLMYTENDLKTFKETKQEMETLSNDLNTFLDKVRQMLDLLKNNSNSWTIENGQLYFDSDQLVNQYNQLYNELNQLAQEKFASSQSTTNQTQSDI